MGRFTSKFGALSWRAACAALLLSQGCGQAGSDGPTDTGNGTSTTDAGTPDGGSEPGPDSGSVSMDLGSPPVAGSAMIGPEGGRLTTPESRVFLEVPPGALTETVEITLVEVEGPASAVGTVVDLGPDGLRFAQPATLGLVFEPDRIPGGFTEDDLVAAYLEEDAWVSVLPTQVDADAEALTALVDHFSVVGATVLAGASMRISDQRDFGETLSNIVLDPEQPDYIVERPAEPGSGPQGLIVTKAVRIEPGVKIAFEADTNFFMQGDLDAQGTEEAPIIFEGFSADGEPPPQAGHWRGLTLAGRSADGLEGQFILRNAIIRHAGGAYDRPATYDGLDLLSASLGTLGNNKTTEIRDVLIEDGLGLGFDMMTYNSLAARFVSIDRLTIRRVQGFAVGVFPATDIGEVTVEEVGDPRVWIRGGETENLRIPGIGVPFVVGMTPEEVADYQSFFATPEREIFVQNDLRVDAGGIIEYTEEGGIRFRTDDDDDVPRLRVEGTESNPVTVRPASPGVQCDPFIVLNEGDNLIRHAVFESCSSVIIVPPRTAIRIEDTLVRDSDCVVFRSSTENTVELVRVELENTPRIECQDI